MRRLVTIAVLVVVAGLAVVLPAAGARHLAAPKKLRGSATSTTSVVLHWSDHAHGETSYRITFAGHTVTARANATSVKVSGLRPGRAYVFAVKACNAKGCSAAARVHVSTGSGETGPAGPTPTIGGCSVFPADNAWNKDVSRSAVDPRSDKLIAGLGGNLHPDFGSGKYGDYGIPYTVVPADQPKVPITFTAYGDESDPGPYPVPLDAHVEGGANADGDRHVLVVQQGSCKLYELYAAKRTAKGWSADSGAVFDLNSDRQRPAGWTSADAAGLPITPGLARADEASAGAIHHALRFTVSRSRKAYVAPARHAASNDTSPDLPPMGMRVRLKASFNTSGYHGQALAILRALKTYGMIVADNGSNWYISGAPDPRWNDDDLDQLKRVPGSSFEVVQSGTLHTR